MNINFIPNYTDVKNAHIVNRMYEKNISTFNLPKTYQEVIGAILGMGHNMSIKSSEDAMAAYFGIKHTLLIPTQDETNKVFNWIRSSMAPNIDAIATALELSHFNSIVNFFCNKTFEKWVENYESNSDSYDQPFDAEMDIADYISFMNDRERVTYRIGYQLFSLIARSHDTIGVVSEYNTNFVLKNPVEDFSFILKNKLIVNSKSIQKQQNSFDINSLLNNSVGKIGMAVMSITKADNSAGTKIRLPHIICII